MEIFFYKITDKIIIEANSIDEAKAIGERLMPRNAIPGRRRSSTGVGYMLRNVKPGTIIYRNEGE